MTTRTARFGTALSAFVTGVVVPVLLQYLANTNKTPIVIKQETPPVVAPSPTPPAAPVPSEVRVVAQGVGRSPDEAWYDAVRTALRTFAASLVDGQTWSQSGTLICNQVLQDDRGLVVRCEDVRCTPEGRL